VFDSSLDQEPPQARLAEALRENLKKRKKQSRSRKDDAN